MTYRSLNGRVAAGTAVAVFLLFYYVLGLVATHVAKGIIESERHNISGAALQIGDYSFSALRASVMLKDVKIFPAGKETDDSLLASADQIYVRISLLSLLRKQLHVEKALLLNPRIRYVMERNDVSNWTGVKPIHARVVVDDIKIENADLYYQDKRNGMSIELQHVNITVDDIKPSHWKGHLPTSIDFSAGIAKTASVVTLSGKASLFGDGIDFEMKGKMSPAPVGIFAPFYRGQVPFPVVGGAVSIGITAKAVDSQFTSTNHVVLSGLRVGGGLEGSLVNKFILSQAGPIVFTVTVSGDLSTGQFSIANGLSKNIASELVARAAGNAPAALAKDVEKDVAKPIEKGGKSIGKALKRLFH